jgi:hypothetical protein
MSKGPLALLSGTPVIFTKPMIWVQDEDGIVLVAMLRISFGMSSLGSPLTERHSRNLPLQRGKIFANSFELLTSTFDETLLSNCLES